jgi:hypothetical protein
VPSSQCFSTDMIYYLYTFSLLSLGRYLFWWTNSPRGWPKIYITYYDCSYFICFSMDSYEIVRNSVQRWWIRKYYLENANFKDNYPVNHVNSNALTTGLHLVVSVSVLTCFTINLRFSYYHWVYTSATGLLFPENIIHPVVSASVLTWFIIYIRFHYYHSKL